MSREQRASSSGRCRANCQASPRHRTIARADRGSLRRMATAAEFAIDEFQGVVRDPAKADRGSPESSAFRRAEATTSRRIDMRHFPRAPRRPACYRPCKRTDSRPSADATAAPARASDLAGDPIPVLGLLGEQAHVAEVVRFNSKIKGPWAIVQHAGNSRGRLQRPCSDWPRSKRASAAAQSCGAAFFTSSAAGQGRSSNSGPKRSSRRPLPKSRS